MKVIDTPMGAKVIHMGSDEDAVELQRVLNARHAFILGYMVTKGWAGSPEDLSMEQILEIRQQEGWKNPTTDWVTTAAAE